MTIPKRDHYTHAVGLSVRLKEELFNDFDYLCKNMDVTKSDAIRFLIAKWLMENRE